MRAMEAEAAETHTCETVPSGVPCGTRAPSRLEVRGRQPLAAKERERERQGRRRSLACGTPECDDHRPSNLSLPVGPLMLGLGPRELAAVRAYVHHTFRSPRAKRLP